MLSALRPYQYEGVEITLNFFFEGNKGNPMIAMPCGTGKSWVIAGFIKKIFHLYPNQRIIVSVPTKELVVQNVDKMHKMWANAPVGINAAGLNRKDVIQPIIFGTMHSIVKSIDNFGHRDLLLVDECHTVSPKENTTYQKIINCLTEKNPNLRIIGLTATKFRMGQGLLTDNGIFTDICYDLTNVDSFNRFLAEGYLCPLVPKPTKVSIDREKLTIVNGDFSKGQSDEAADKIMYEALTEAVEYGYDKDSWLIFTAGVKSSETASEVLSSFGICSAAVHSKLSSRLRDERIRDFKSGKIKALCGMGIFLTGFDHPPVDLIVGLRPTVSPSLHVQMLGRGMRTSPNKKYCLVLDYAGNVKNLGPINDPRIPRKKGKATGEVPIKICEQCGTYNHAAARICCNPECNFEFKFQTKLNPTAYTDAIMRSDAPVIEYYDVTKVIYHKHEKIGSPPMIKVSYFAGLKRFVKFVCLEHQGFAGKNARDWFRQHYAHELPVTTDEALAIVSMLRVPRRIRVWTNKKFPEIMGYEW